MTKQTMKLQLLITTVIFLTGNNVLSQKPEVDKDVKMCANVSQIQAASANCQKLTSNVTNNAECRKFFELINCIASNMFSGNTNTMRTQCTLTMHTYIQDHSEQFTTVFSNNSMFKPATCEAKRSTCGNGREPLDNYQCLDQLCPQNYTCRKGFCCPQERKGMCPTPVGIPMCGQRCTKDFDCLTDEKCCYSQGCGAFVCAKLETKEKTECEKEFDNAKKLLGMSGSCGDGKSLLSVPRCQNGRYYPIQGDLQNGKLYCVDVEGMQMSGSEFTGNQDCTNGSSNRSVPDTCLSRSCCPITLCQGQICQADVTAVCRINSCSGCKVEFFDVLGNQVNCTEGVSQCVSERDAARKEYSVKKQKTEDQLVISFLNAYSRMSSNADENTLDEYGDVAKSLDELPDDEIIDATDGNEADNQTMHFCNLLEQYGICKNNGTCGLTKVESWQFCECLSGYRGPFCETEGNSTNVSRCEKAAENFGIITNYLLTPEKLETLFLYQIIDMFRMPFSILPINYSCINGTFNAVQVGKLLPFKSDTRHIIYCAETDTGMRQRNTAVVFHTSPEVTKDINCSVTYQVDILSLPVQCMVQKNLVCANSSLCQYYYNAKTGMCEDGAAENGFDSLTECYDTCGRVRPMESCENCDVPLPCLNPQCNYTQQFCSVTSVNGSIHGECKNFPKHCFEGKDNGDGNKSIGAYYFDAASRKCKKFNYTGDGGNNNRFYNLHQCHTECSSRLYKYDVPVCPKPGALPMDNTETDLCDDDTNCPNDMVCCSNGHVRICTDPVSTCSTGQRCSRFGACDGASCVCPDCSSVNTSQVCGSDGVKYDSLCLLKRQACLSMTNITQVELDQCGVACGEKVCSPNEICNNVTHQCHCNFTCNSTNNYVCGQESVTGVIQTFDNLCVMKQRACGNKLNYRLLFERRCDTTGATGCVMPCSKEYKPLCVLDQINSTNTYNNSCAVKAAKLCNNKTLLILYAGACVINNTCNGTQCRMYQTCVNNQCTCPLMCTREYMPVCGYPKDNSTSMTTFSNLCEMRQHACISNQMYILYKHGPCAKSGPIFQCPKFLKNIPFSAEFACNISTNAYCDQVTEMCCPYGAGTRCLSLTMLTRAVEVKTGVCRTVSLLDYDKIRCIPEKCTNDLDCAGAAKCCMNQVCGYGTCAEPAVTTNVCENTLGMNYTLISDLQCDPTAGNIGCPSMAKCITDNITQGLLDNGNLTIGVCCKLKSRTLENQEKARAGICFVLSKVGLGCQNNGTCVGKLTEGDVCECHNGFYGTFCEKRLPLENCSSSANTCDNTLCNQTSCPAYPAANCSVSSCSGCQAVFTTWGTTDVTKLCYDTPCLKRKDISTKIYDAIFRDFADMFMKQFSNLLTLMDIVRIPLNGEVFCTPEGQFEQVQCFMTLDGKKVHCNCVNKANGMDILNGLEVVPNQKQTLECSFASQDVFQEFCLEVPQRSVSCGEMEADRYFFNPASLDCEIFTDTGCNINLENSFNNYFTCMATCGMRRISIPSKCDNFCPNAECHIRNGEPFCIANDTSPMIFEPQCDSNGNFKSKQCIGELCVCMNDSLTFNLGSVTEGYNLRCDKVCSQEWKFIENITVRWSMYPDMNVVQFEIHLSAGTPNWTSHQWIGLGLSPNGSMINSDIYTIEDTTGNPWIINRFANGHIKPPADPVQNMTVNFTQADGNTTFTFRRPIALSNPTDYSLDKSYFLILAYGAYNATSRSIDKHIKIDVSAKINFNCSNYMVAARKLAEPKYCRNGSAPMFCEVGDPCNKCALPSDSQGNQTVNANGTCMACDPCLVNRTKASCPTHCFPNSTCMQFPAAVCRINKCTCAAEFMAWNKVINCSTVHSRCEKWKFDVELHQKFQALTNSVMSNNVQVKCSMTGSYEAICEGSQCYCLNATSGQKVGNAQTLTDINNINCSEVQKTTIPINVTVSVTVTKNKRLNDFNQTHQEKIISDISSAFSTAVQANVVTILRDGSVLADITVVNDPNSTVVTGTSDFISQVDAVVYQINLGEVVIVVGDDTLILSEAIISKIIPAQQAVETTTTTTTTTATTQHTIASTLAPTTGTAFTTQPTTRVTTQKAVTDVTYGESNDETKRNNTIIIVVVVVGVAVIIAIVVGIYFYRKKYHNGNNEIEHVQFTDLQARDNPNYSELQLQPDQTKISNQDILIPEIQVDTSCGDITGVENPCFEITNDLPPIDNKPVMNVGDIPVL